MNATISTAADLHALPALTVVLSAGVPCEKWPNGHWYIAGDPAPFDALVLARGPVPLVYRPDAAADAVPAVEAEHGAWDKANERYEDGCKTDARPHIVPADQRAELEALRTTNQRLREKVIDLTLPRHFGLSDQDWMDRLERERDAALAREDALRAGLEALIAPWDPLAYCIRPADVRALLEAAARG